MLKKMYNVILCHLPINAQVSIRHFRKHNSFPRLGNPRSFNEHIAKLKCAPHTPLMVECSDKVQVKNWVSQKIGHKFIIPNLWHGISLPSQEELDKWVPFVMKASHGSGLIKIVTHTTDRQVLQNLVDKWMSYEWPAYSVERWYNEIPREALIEPMLEGPPPDYKFFCFSGVPRIIQVDVGRFSSHERAFYDVEWRRLSFGLEYPLYREVLERPMHLNDMLYAAKELSSGFDFVRVDLYDTEGGPKFGEMTFAPGAGFETFDPPEVDQLLGAFWGGQDSNNILSKYTGP